MFCKNCGKELKDGTAFCSECGAKQAIQNDLSEKSDNETIKDNESTTASEANTNDKKKSSMISGILSVVVAFAILWVAIAGVKWVFSAVGSWFDGKNETGKQSSEQVDGRILIYDSEPIVINNITFDAYSITYDFENISDKDIAYISFETYFYDRMGGALKLDINSDDYLKLDYTGPLYSGNTDSAYWDYLLEIPTGTAVVYPKKITVTFTDDKKVTFENDVYCHTDDFYGGELKD